jgi:hypothetical protein
MWLLIEEHTLCPVKSQFAEILQLLIKYLGYFASSSLWDSDGGNNHCSLYNVLHKYDLQMFGLHNCIWRAVAIHAETHSGRPWIIQAKFLHTNKHVAKFVEICIISNFAHKVKTTSIFVFYITLFQSRIIKNFYKMQPHCI